MQIIGECICAPHVTGTDDNPCSECEENTFGYDPITGCQVIFKNIMIWWIIDSGDIDVLSMLLIESAHRYLIMSADIADYYYPD